LTFFILSVSKKIWNTDLRGECRGQAGCVCENGFLDERETYRPDPVNKKGDDFLIPNL